MNFCEHYGEQTKDILIGGLVPFGNSLPINKCFIGKKFAKVIKKSEYEIINYMNAVFEKEQESIVVGDLHDWSLDGLHIEVYVIGITNLNVKGKNVWAYALGIIE
ncbi:MAG: hypothetical protein K0S95_764 [Pantoea eucrina]|jgi:hypothetical protein|nr:hypothetical protein [Pantoea eucrina]